MRAALRGALPGRVPVPLQYRRYELAALAAQAAEGLEIATTLLVAASDPAVPRAPSNGSGSRQPYPPRRSTTRLRVGQAAGDSPGTILGTARGTRLRTEYHWLPDASLRGLAPLPPACRAVMRQPPKIHKHQLYHLSWKLYWDEHNREIRFLNV